MGKIEQIKSYIRKGMKHYRDQKDSSGVEALQNVLNYVNSLDKPQSAEPAADPIYHKFEAVILTRFTEFDRSFYEGLTTGPVTVYQEVQHKRGRATQIALESVGFGHIGITGNIIYLQGQMIELNNQQNTIVLCQDSEGGPAVKVVASSEPNLRYVI